MGALAMAGTAAAALGPHASLRIHAWSPAALWLGCAALGVGLMLFRVGHVPWVALALAGTWASYGLLKKKSTLGPIAGLTVETLL